MVDKKLKRLKQFGCLALLGLGVVAQPAQASDPSGAAGTLGGQFLVCEASAAVLVDCPSTNGTCLLEGDNEFRHDIFLYDLHPDTSAPIGGRPIALGREMSDIEALVRLPSGDVIIYGSHSRNKTCEAKGKRRQFYQIRFGDNGLEEVAAFKSRKLNCDRLFGKPQDDLAGHLRKVCDEIERTEKLARAIEKRAEEGGDEGALTGDCEADPAFNLEGAVALQDEAGSERVWVGLRAPLVEGKAVLLRQIADRSKFQFDAVAFLDLGGHGVRELSFAEQNKLVWVIGGPHDDARVNHTLWRFPAASLATIDGQGDADIKPESVPVKLEPFAEGLAVHEAFAIVLMDGDEPEEHKPFCERASTYRVLKHSN